MGMVVRAQFPSPPGEGRGEGELQEGTDFGEIRRVGFLAGLWLVFFSREYVWRRIGLRG